MRALVIVTLLAAVVAAGKREERYRKLGDAQLAAFSKAKSNASRLRRLRRAAYYYRRAGKEAVSFGDKSVELGERGLQETAQFWDTIAGTFRAEDEPEELETAES